ncbi:MAG: hypothetical protein HQL73_09555 [Magnetococcales bacterium]|nr:hypothetical protein [Magnetococcales bacterium]
MTENIDKYAAIDFSYGESEWKALESQLESESNHTHVNLSDHVGPIPANLTNGMQVWFASHVQPLRKAALDEVERQFSSNSRCIFLPRKLDKIEDERLSSRRKCFQEFKIENTSLYNNLQHAKSEQQIAHDRYLALVAKHNRAPKLLPWWYFLALFFILPTEVAINYETFMAVKWMTPILAGGTVVILGMVLAASAHLIGTLIRQYHILFDSSRDDTDRLVGWRMLAIGTFAFVIVLASVWYARSTYFSDQIKIIGILKGGSQSEFYLIGGSMLSNLAVWLAGVMIAFFQHDSDPDFPKSLEDLNKKTSLAQRLQESVDKQLQKRFRDIDSKANREKKEALNTDHSFPRETEYQNANLQFSRILKQDEHVLALLVDYRKKLLDKNSEIKFEKCKPLGDGMEVMSGTEYAAESLRLKYV